MGNNFSLPALDFEGHLPFLLGMAGAKPNTPQFVSSFLTPLVGEAAFFTYLELHAYDMIVILWAVC